MSENEGSKKARSIGKRTRSAKERRSKPDRGSVTLYLDKALFRRFANECDGLGQSASGIVEDLMRGFIGED